MYFLYSILLTVGFLLLSPLFIARRGKYAAGIFQRLGKYPEFNSEGLPVIWLHCVSVGETNAARPLVDEIKREFSGNRLIISTTTKTGQELARDLFREEAAAVFYFPFDWKFSVQRALRHFRPSLVLLMETEIWPRFIYEASKAGCRVAIVNGRLSARSARSYARVGFFIRRVLPKIDRALMQGAADAERIISIGMAPSRVAVTGNIKFDFRMGESEARLTNEFQQRFAIDESRPLILAASTHKPEELWILKALFSEPSATAWRLMIAPRHPERFDAVAEEIELFCRSGKARGSNLRFVRRSNQKSEAEMDADIILLDTIGELRAAYPLAEIVFVGGSLIRHGGQNVLEPAAAGKAIITGPFTHNFADINAILLANDALIQLEDAASDDAVAAGLRAAIEELLSNATRRRAIAANATESIKVNRGAVTKTIANIKELLDF